MAYLTYDIQALKACAVTCFTWYNVATPHLHHTLTLRQWATDASRTYLNPLEYLHKLELLPFIKQVQFERGIFGSPWVVPRIFDPESIQYFGALENLQNLAIADLDFSRFPVGVGEYFGHSSSRLRSVALNAPRGTRRQLLDFFRLFPELDDIKISHYYPWTGAYDALDTPLIPIRGELRGQLTLIDFSDEELLKDIIVAFGGIRFTSMDLDDVLGMQLLLEACADSLEAVHIHPGDGVQLCKRVLDPSEYFTNVCADGVLLVLSQRLNLSCNTALRSLEVSGSFIVESPKHARTIRELLSTITSPAFSEVIIVFYEPDVRWPPRGLNEVLREMYKVKGFRVGFCLKTLDELRVPSLHQLTLDTRAAVVRGTYDFLPFPPSVFSRTVTRYDRFELKVV